MKYKNLEEAMGWYMEDMWIPYEESLNIIKRRIDGGMLDENELKNEFESAIKDEDFDWISLAKDTLLLANPDDYSNIEIKDYVKILFHKYIFPEKKMTESEITNLSMEIVNILKNYKRDDGWMNSYDLFDRLKQQKQFENLEFFYLTDISYKQLNIELRHIENKERIMGFLRYNPSIKK